MNPDDNSPAENQGAPDAAARVKTGGEAMALAFELARETLPHFWDVYARPQAGESDFGLKVKLADAGGSEYLWAGGIEPQGGKVFGVIAGRPTRVKSVTEGQRLELPPEDIVDWKYLRDGKMVGNYTARVLARMLPPAEARKYLETASNLVPIKVKCSCRHEYAIEVQAVAGRMPGRIQCPVCGADGTAAANEKLDAVFQGLEPLPPAAVNASSLAMAPSVELPTQAPIKVSAAALRTVKAEEMVPEPVSGGGFPIRGLMVVVVLGLAWFAYQHWPHDHSLASALPEVAREHLPEALARNASPGAAPPGGANNMVADKTVFLHDRHATFTDLQGNAYTDVILTIADERSVYYYKTGSVSGNIALTNLPAEFLLGLGMPTNWPGVLK